MKGRAPHFALVLIACAALLLRLRFLLVDGGPLASPTEYDDGVYFSASALLLRGVLPYRDFVFVHPPGAAWFYGITSWFHDPAIAFAAGRVLACFAGAISTFLAGAIVLRSGSVFGAIVAAILYATYPDAITAEKSTLLEPVLNLACLASAFVWLSPRKERFVTAGLLAGSASAIKLLGGIWVIAAIASAISFRSVKRFLLGGIAAGIVLLGPLVFLAPKNFLAQVLLFQFTRPPDGTLTLAERLPLILGSGHLAATILAAVALIAMCWSRTREERFFAVATLLTIAAFLASSSYWTQYNAYLAASQCVLAGLGAARLVRVRMWIAIPIGVAVAMLMRIPHPSSAPELIALRNTLPPNASLFAFDPSWSLVAGQLPPHGDGAPAIVDSYATMLLTAMRSGETFIDVNDAFRRTPSQPEVRARLERSQHVIVGWRGNWQLPEADLAWLTAHSLCITPEAGSLCIRERLTRPFDALTTAGIVFGDGWHGEEGTPPQSWRWMTRSGTIALPESATASRLHLELDVPLESLAKPATITIALDGRLLERFVANTREQVRIYDIGGNDATRTITIATDQTFVPARSGTSGDQRELGVMLKRVLMLPGRRAAAPAQSSVRSPSA